MTHSFGCNICNEALCTFFCFAADDNSMAKKKSNIEPSPILFVRNLPLDATESDLMETFNGCAVARIAVNPRTGKSKG